MAETYRSIGDLFLQRTRKSPGNPAFMHLVGKEWKTLTWAETGERVRRIASGLRALGLEDEQRVAIQSNTRLEWVLADLGIMCAGGATTTIYPANTEEESGYILKDSDTVLVFVESAEYATRIGRLLEGAPTVRKVIVLDGPAPDAEWALTLSALEEMGRAYDEAHPGRYEEVIASVTPDRLATLIYTSGTTGQPKGVELTQDCWLYEGEAIEALGVISEDDVQYLWLPLAHSFGKVLQAAQIRIGFATAVDGKVESIIENLAVVKPTFMAAVPRIFEKVYAKVMGQVQNEGGAKLKIFEWALDVGKQVSKLTQEGRRPSLGLYLQHTVADGLVFSKLRARFGGRIRCFISGSAPLAKDLAEFFHAAGLLILEGYGLTETSAATFVNRPEKYRFGSVGLPVKGTEVKIAEEDGEILIRGRGVMRGYHNLPDATRETLTPDGWLRTGDIGHLDADGLLTITDRKKDLIKTSGGKYVAPQAVEGKLKVLCRFVSQVVVHGNNRNYCTALLTLNEEEIRTWARQNGLGEKSYAELAADPKVEAFIGTFVEQLNSRLAKWESIKKFAILPADLTVESGELTPSLKVKRKLLETKFKSRLEGFYGADA